MQNKLSKLSPSLNLTGSPSKYHSCKYSFLLPAIIPYPFIQSTLHNYLAKKLTVANFGLIFSEQLFAIFISISLNFGQYFLVKLFLRKLISRRVDLNAFKTALGFKYSEHFQIILQIFGWVCKPRSSQILTDVIC